MTKTNCEFLTDESEMDRFVEGDDNEENVATPNPHDRHELIKILDPNSSEGTIINLNCLQKDPIFIFHLI